MPPDDLHAITSAEEKAAVCLGQNPPSGRASAISLVGRSSVPDEVQAVLLETVTRLGGRVMVREMP